MDAGLDERTLRRIIALLVSFAGLAECAAGRSLSVRWFVLVILRYGERVTQDYLAETTGLDWAECFEDDPKPGSHRMDAERLAWRLRALAGMLGALLPPPALLHVLDAWKTGRDVVPGVLAAYGRGRRVAPGGWAYQAPDTS